MRGAANAIGAKTVAVHSQSPSKVAIVLTAARALLKPRKRRAENAALHGTGSGLAMHADMEGVHAACIGARDAKGEPRQG